MKSDGGRAVRDVFGVLIDAARLLARHWPVLLALALAGVALRGAAIWAAVEVSDDVAWLGQGLVVLAPLGFLLPLVAMLHLMRHDLPNVRRADEATAPDDATTGRERRLLDVASSVLVPFLAVYVSYGFLAQDLQQFVNEAGADEFNQIDFFGTGAGVDYSRILINSWQLVLMLVAIAWVLRFLLARAERRFRFLGLALVGALVEVYWIGQAAGYLERQRDDVRLWLQDRRLVDWTVDRYDAVVANLGPLGSPVDTATTWLFGLLGSFDAVVVVPLAWITVAAVVLGHKLAPAPPLEHPLLDRAKGVPRPVARAAGGLADDLRSRFSALTNGLRLMARAGLVPMLLFGLAFLVALRIPYLVSVVWRAVVGPVPSNTFVAFAPIESALGTALSVVVLATLLAAATDRMLLATGGTPRRSTAGATTPEPR